MNLTDFDLKEVSETLQIPVKEIQIIFGLTKLQQELKTPEQARIAYWSCYGANDSFLREIEYRWGDLIIESLDNVKNIKEAQFILENCPNLEHVRFCVRLKILEFSDSIKRSKSCYLQTPQNSLIYRREILEIIIKKFCKIPLKKNKIQLWIDNLFKIKRRRFYNKKNIII